MKKMKWLLFMMLTVTFATTPVAWKAEAATTQKVGVVVNVKTGLNIRAGAGTNYKIIGVLKNGTAVSVLSKVNGWYQIKYKDITGYVLGSYIKLLDNQVVKKEDVRNKEEVKNDDKVLKIDITFYNEEGKVIGSASGLSLNSFGQNVSFIQQIPSGADRYTININ
ncbi:MULTISPECIES: SH3 domain-containing protein [Aneurinibacillus]|uniref:SH3 domain-containing protein n=1 Tax=Aneurinibacillus thermoaerophilus TaxID=143495 RepID=A0A1G8A512_ANETH|nr:MULTISPECIES: SH3 domain-containing protein [Aneurinibacillus]AMA74111.1 hypothetical protein ACH33_15660 [Aneurinibacillus sp. XH2]MED0675489.1 SH3 domain-containing protein [Aneurinibacillus thermoaerophilus]MED0678844.1 SH3 domain-containing protein [Aneurinibacillus thermoaerophilus]MED0736717.1 SH3 domain-containing protein [Aneurinibacillus thermoaerophilus]MED0758372.1 SH3 domain-containing protein [Aneurinibacillus thermoaerophilus]